MKFHLIQSFTVAMTLALGGFLSPAAWGQYTADGSTSATIGAGYPTTGQPGYAPYASTGYGEAVTPIRQLPATSVYPTTSQQPLRVAMNTQSGVVESPAAPPLPTPTLNPQPLPPADIPSSDVPATTGCDCYGEDDYGLSGYFESAYNRRQWFCGVYGLAMERDEPSNYRVGLLVDTADIPAAPGSYVPVPSDTVLHSNNAGYEYRGGVELRFGSTFQCGTAYDCGSGYCAPQNYAWEFGYWYLAEDPSSSIFINDDPEGALRMYSGINFSGLTIPGLDAENYVIPIQNEGDQRILAERVRSNFSAQNFELNILRLPFFGYGNACGGCCDGAACGPSFQMAGLCGFRYMRLDDDFQYAFSWGEGAPLDPAEFDGFDLDTALLYNISVDNNLAGFQLGFNMNYCCGSCWDLLWDTNFGLYNNHISSTQNVRLGDGTAVTYVNGGSEARVHSNKDTFAFLGEMRLGAAYHINCNNRLTLAYRVVAIGGVALTTDQIPTTFDSPAYVGLIDSSGSLVMHGIQAGWERRF